MFSYRVLSGISTIMCGQAAVIRCMNWIGDGKGHCPGRAGTDSPGAFAENFKSDLWV